MIDKKRKVAVFINSYRDVTDSFSKEITNVLEAENWEVISVFAGKDEPDLNKLKDLSLCLSLGGDGTFLYAARTMAVLGVPILPIHYGTLGFVAWVTKDEWKTRFDEAVNGSLLITDRYMLQISVQRDEKCLVQYNAMNEGVVSGSGPAKMVSLGVKVNDSELGDYRSDGLLVATPTGSSAYSMAAGGPVLVPDMDALVFTPLCPFTLSNRPLVIPGKDKLEILVKSRQREKTMLTVDGQEYFDLQEGDKVLFHRSNYRVKVFSGTKSYFFPVLRSKLNWSGGPCA